MREIIWGAISMGCAAIALFFFRYWRDTRDRLFGIFAAAFLVLGVNWAGIAIADPPNETRHYFYIVRLAAFVLILFGIIDKNRPRAK